MRYNRLISGNRLSPRIKAALSPHLARFQEKTGAVHALQVAIDNDSVDGDCFSLRRPAIVPAKTFLSQLI